MNSKSLIFLGLLLIALAGDLGCAGKSNGELPKEIDPDRLQTELMDFADTFVTATVDTYDQLAARTPTPDAKRFALKRKLGTAQGAYINASNPNPAAGLINMLVLV